MLKTTLKIDGGNDDDDVSVDIFAVIDFGTKTSSKFGLHHLAKVDANATFSKNGQNFDEKFLNFEAVLLKTLNDLSVGLQGRITAKLFCLK